MLFKMKYTLAIILLMAYLVKIKAKEKNESLDTCYEGREGIFPCSSTITGNLILIVFYGMILGVAAKCISDGAEMLLDFGLPPGIIGGVLLPVLGAVPDCGIIIASGLGDNAQEKLSVGMGTLAGSTVMLLSIAWASSLIVGRCDLNEKGESVDKRCKGKFSLTRQGVTLLPDIKSSITIMLITSLLYFIVQSADWYWGATAVGTQPPYVRKAALATFVFCIIGFIGYITFSILDSKHNERLVRLHKEELSKRKVIHTMLTFATRPSAVVPPKDDSTDSPAAPTVANRYFKAWKVKTGSKDIEEKLGLLQEESSEEEEKPVESKEKQEPSSEGILTLDIIKCISLLIGGVALVTIFSDPMCEVLTSLTNKNNKSYVPIPSFYVSFVVTPFCSNASELVSSLIFASKKTRENLTLTYSQIFGAATMNNTLCLAIFMLLVYLKDLEWVYGAEVLCIVAAEVVVGMISYKKTYKVGLAIPIGIVYVMCILLVFLLEFQAGWK